MRIIIKYITLLALWPPSLLLIQCPFCRFNYFHCHHQADSLKKEFIKEKAKGQSNSPQPKKSYQEQTQT